jgi:hypothetical protein
MKSLIKILPYVIILCSICTFLTIFVDNDLNPFKRDCEKDECIPKQLSEEGKVFVFIQVSLILIAIIMLFINNKNSVNKYINIVKSKLSLNNITKSKTPTNNSANVVDGTKAVDGTKVDDVVNGTKVINENGDDNSSSSSSSSSIF